MNRLGFRYDNLADTVPMALAGAGLDIDAVYTHFATAEDLAHPRCSRRSVSGSTPRCARCRSWGIRPRRRHAGNSAALLRDHATWFDAVRPGVTALWCGATRVVRAAVVEASHDIA